MADRRPSARYQTLLDEARQLRVWVPVDRRVLFDDLLKIAALNQKQGRAAVAVKDLEHAKGLARVPQGEDSRLRAQMKQRRAKLKPVRLGVVARQVLAIAGNDYDDDRDGAEFWDANQRAAVKKLAEQGLLRTLSEDRGYVRAVLTEPGASLLARLRGDAPVLYVVRLRRVGSNFRTFVNGEPAGDSAVSSTGSLVGQFRYVVGQLREQHPGARFDLPGGMHDEKALITGAQLLEMLESV